MIIVHVAEYASGGVATYLRNLINMQLQDERVDEVYLINSKYRSEDFDFHSEKFNQYTYEYKRSVSGLLKLFKLRRYIDSIKPDVVHFHSSFAGIIRLSYLFKKANYKVVYCAHGWSFLQKDKSKMQTAIYSTIEKLAAIKTDIIVNISKNESEEAISRGLPKQKMKLIYNSISKEHRNIDVGTPFNSGYKKLLFIGRFDKQKGLDFLLNSFDFDESDIELVIIGKPVISEDGNKYTDTKNVKYIGWVDNKNIGSYISHCDALIIPSLWEGFGLVALEAMKEHKMVISSNTGGLNEIITENVNGLKFITGSKESLIQKLNKFENMSNKEIVTMGSKGYEIFNKRYNIDDLYEQLMSLYFD